MLKARPALIIGLGGTGQWVLTYIKRDLQEAYGKVPPNVRFLCFDTEVEPTAQADGGIGDSDLVPPLVGIGEEVPREQYEELFGKVSLGKEEYKHLGANVRSYVQAIAQRAHPHVGSWFPAQWFLEHQPGAVLSLKEGAAAWRQFGRLAVFFDVRNPGSSKILQEIRRAMQQVQQAGSDTGAVQGSLEVLIVCSLVGGTGAGMAVDIANLIKSEVAASVQDLVLRGFFVLPRAFGAWETLDDSSTKQRARAFAAWRELDRFRVPGAVKGLPMRYGPDRLDTRIQSPPFDIVYLVDGARDGATLKPAGHPEWHVFPTIADFAGVILDPSAGKEYSQQVINLNQTHPDPRKPRYSALGTYTLKSPVYYVMQEQSHRFGREMVEKLLAPLPVRGRKLEWTLAPDQNLEDKETTGRERRGREAAPDFLTARTVRWTDPDGITHEAHNTMLPPAISMAIDSIGEQRQQVFEDWVRGALRARWWDTFTDLGTMEGGIPTEEQEALAVRLASRVRLSRALKEDPALAPDRFQRDIPPFYATYYGGLKANQQTESRGQYGDALEARGQQQVERFAEFLRLWLQRTLMGQSDDVKKARSGKLGFALDFADGLIEALDKFQSFLRSVVAKREDAKIQIQAEQRVAQRERELQRWARRRMLFWPHPKAYSTQEAYLRAWQDRINVRKDDLFLLAVGETVEEMQRLATQVREQLQRWANVLVGNPNLGYTGLYHDLEVHLDQRSVGRARNADQFGDIQQLFDVKMDRQIQDELLDEALKNWRWDVTHQVEDDEDRDQLVVSCYLEPLVQDVSAEPIALTTQAATSIANVDRVVDLAEQAHQAVWDRHRIASLLLERYPGDNGPAGLANALFGKAEPLYDVSGAGQAGALEKTQWLRASWKGDTEQKFFDDVVSALAARDASLNNTRRVPQQGSSVDPYRLTLTRTDDLVPSRDFQEWYTCRKCYVEVAEQYQQTYGHKLAGQLMHILPAESNALRYELERKRITGQEYQPFDPLVVAGLEDVEHAKLFFWSLLLGYLRLVEDENGACYRLEYPMLDYDGNIQPGKSMPEIHLTWYSRPGGSGDDIFAALTNMAGKGEDRKPHSEQRVAYEWLEKAIRAQMAEIGKSTIQQRVLDMLKAEDGYVARWRRKAHELTLEQAARSAKEDPAAYADLSDLAVLLMVESSEEDYRVKLDLGEGYDRTRRMNEIMRVRS